MTKCITFDSIDDVCALHVYIHVFNLKPIVISKNLDYFKMVQSIVKLPAINQM